MKTINQPDKGGGGANIKRHALLLKWKIKSASLNIINNNQNVLFNWLTGGSRAKTIN